MISTPEHSRAALEKAASLPDDALDLADTALHLAALHHPGISLGRYTHHFSILSSETKGRFDDLIAAGAADNAETRLAALKHIIADKHGYDGDRDHYDDTRNADLIQVIDRRRGLPIALGILYIQTGRALGWDVSGLNFPGHFICRLDHDGHRLIFDPFNAAKLLQAADLRNMLKLYLGPSSELSAQYYEPAGNRDILLRLQNNVKSRLIESEDYTAALEIVAAMRLLSPGDIRLLFDAGVLTMRTGKLQAALQLMESYHEKATSPADRRQAAAIIEEIRRALALP